MSWIRLKRQNFDHTAFQNNVKNGDISYLQSLDGTCREGLAARGDVKDVLKKSACGVTNEIFERLKEDSALQNGRVVHIWLIAMSRMEE